MEIKQYVQACISQADMEELAISWSYAGKSIATSSTRFYKSGNVYLIDDPNSLFNNQLFYCNENYVGQVNWAEVNTLTEANRTTLKNGLTALCFDFFNTTLDPTTVDAIVTNAEAQEGFAPFTKYAALSEANDDIYIDDTQYYQIMQVIGQPYIKDSELEYKRQAILKLAVEPALRMYYTYFPLTQEQVIQHNLGDFLIPYPTVPYPAYKAIAWVTSPGQTGGRSMNGLSPLAALGTDMNIYTRAATGNRFAQGLRYNKPVPGYTGEGTAGGGSAYSELATAWPIANTMKNIMRREKLSKIHIPGQGLFAKGYSTMSGYLNIRWLCWSRDFNDVEFEDWNTVVQLCQAHVKFSIGAIRDLLRSDSNIPFRDGIQKEGQQEIAEIEKKWSESPYRLIYTPARGGIVG